MAASKPEITTTSIETSSSPEELITCSANRDLQDTLNSTNACPQKIQHRLSLRLSNSPGGSPTSGNLISPRSPKSPNRSISPHHILVNKLYEEEMLADELISTSQVDEDIIEAVNKITVNNAAAANLTTSKQLYSPNRSPDLKKTHNNHLVE